ncbi:hypothetical protein THAOC_21401, partial [Thalassiosira oceanica]
IEVDFAIKPEEEVEAMAKLEAVVSEIALKKEELKEWEGGALGEQLKELEKKQKTQNIYYEASDKFDEEGEGEGDDVERVGRKHNMDRGRAFGGKYNGVVARKIMRHAQDVYSDFLSELKSMIRDGLVKDDVDGLMELKQQVADLLEIWDKF